MDSQLTARVTLGIIFLYHGAVPKILFLSDVEVQMIQAHAITLPYERVAFVGGIAEIALGFALIFLRSRNWPVLVALVALVVLLLDVAVFLPELLVEAFGPVSTNIAGIGLCLIALPKRGRRVPGSAAS